MASDHTNKPFLIRTLRALAQFRTGPSPIGLEGFTFGRAVERIDGGELKTKGIIRYPDSSPWYSPSHDRLASGD